MKHIFMLWKVLMVCLLLANPLASYADFQPSYSTAGFYSLPNTGRTVYDMNPAWRFYKGKIEGAEQKNFDDKKWDIVSLPNGIEYLPVAGVLITKAKYGTGNISHLMKPGRTNNCFFILKL